MSHILQSCSKAVSSGAFAAVLLKFPIFWYAPLYHGWLVPNVSRKLSDLTLKDRNVLESVLILLVTKCPPVVWRNNCFSSQESSKVPTAREPFVVSHPEWKIRQVFFCPEACFKMEATCIPFEKCIVNFNLQLEMSLNHIAENTKFAFQCR
jgi:hypothetical protein